MRIQIWRGISNPQTSHTDQHPILERRTISLHISSLPSASSFVYFEYFHVTLASHYKQTNMALTESDSDDNMLPRLRRQWANQMNLNHRGEQHQEQMALSGGNEDQPCEDVLSQQEDLRGGARDIRGNKSPNGEQEHSNSGDDEAVLQRQL